MQIKLNPGQTLYLIAPPRDSLADLTWMLHVQTPQLASRAYLLPTKSGCWRIVMMNRARLEAWLRAWATWWAKTGRRLAISPEMWG